MTGSSDSLQTNLGLDPLLRRDGMPAFLLYAGGRDLTDPYISPVFGDFTKGFPPAILTTGTATCCSRTRFGCTGHFGRRVSRRSST